MKVFSFCWAGLCLITTVVAFKTRQLTSSVALQSLCPPKSINSIHRFYRSRDAHLQLFTRFDCEAFPKMAEYFYKTATEREAICGAAGGSSKSLMDSLFGSSPTSVDLLGDLQLIGALLLLVFISSRNLLPNFSRETSGADDDDRGEPNSLDEYEDDDDDEALLRDYRKQNAQGFSRRKSPKVASSSSRFNTCPQCNGTKIFLGEVCALCGGSGVVNFGDDSRYFLPDSSHSIKGNEDVTNNSINKSSKINSNEDDRSDSNNRRRGWFDADDE